MTYMTPMEARDALDRDLDWKAELTAGRRALETIAAMQPEYSVRYERLGGRTPARPDRITYVEETEPLELHEAQKQADWINSRDGSALSNARVITRYTLDTETP